jgi:hypothetical protein
MDVDTRLVIALAGQSAGHVPNVQRSHAARAWTNALRRLEGNNADKSPNPRGATDP